VEEFKQFSLEKMFKTKKAQTAGLITGLVFGIASLVIGVIIAFVIVSTLTSANLLTDGRTTTSVINETGAYINSTGYQLTALDTNYVPGTITIDEAFNDTIGFLITSANITISSTGIVTNATAIYWNNATMSYTSSVYSNNELATQDLSANFTKGVDNVSTKIPTILLIAAIVLILGVLVLLVGAWQRMRIGGGSI